MADKHLVECERCNKKVEWTAQGVCGACIHKLRELEKKLDKLKDLRALQHTCIVCSASLTRVESVPHCWDCVPTEEHEAEFFEHYDALEKGGR